MPFEPIRIYFSHLRSSAGVRQAIARVFTGWTTGVIQAVYRLLRGLIVKKNGLPGLPVLVLPVLKLVLPKGSPSSETGSPKGFSLFWNWFSRPPCSGSPSSETGSPKGFSLFWNWFSQWVLPVLKLVLQASLDGCFLTLSSLCF